MNKVVLGLLLGGVLGVFDGLTAWFTPAERANLLGIVMGSTFKGMVAGLAAGLFARKVHSVPLGILFGLVVAAIFAFWVAYSIQTAEGKNYYFQIVLPGSLVGAIVGWATQRYPASRPQTQ